MLDPRIAHAVTYALTGPGKRLRPILLISAYRAAGGRGDVPALAAAVDAIRKIAAVKDAWLVRI